MLKPAVVNRTVFSADLTLGEPCLQADSELRIPPAGYLKTSVGKTQQK